MKAFRYVRVGKAGDAGDEARKGAVLKAGGSDLLDRMKERLTTPDAVVALNEIASPFLNTIEPTDDGGLRIGALVTLAEIAESNVIRKRYPALAKAAGHAASPQVRHRATLGGNLCQHTRCGYYRLASFPCWKRGDDTCPVLADGAVQDTAGIFDNTSCASAHPASVPPVLGALGAKIVVRAEKGREERSFGKLWRAPEKGVAADVALAPGEVIVAVVLPPLADPKSVAYEEVRQKAAFDWALVSCAARVELTEGGVTAASIWLGSVASTPYRAKAADAALVGSKGGGKAIEKAANAAVTGATPLDGNSYKVDLVKVVVTRALRSAIGRDR
jgi:xanthine dehydrogenase YagS FAD-binding subunit